MTPSETIDYYAKLLIKQYVGKPKAFADIQASVEPILMPTGGALVIDLDGNPVVDLAGNLVTVDGLDDGSLLPFLVRDAFDPATAVGVQLRTLAKYSGVGPSGTDLSGLFLTLDEESFRALIQAVMVKNRMRATLSQIDDLVDRFFSGVLQVFDHTGMRNSWFYLAEKGTNPMAELFITGGFLPRPLGVGQGKIIYQFPFKNFFGCRTYAMAAPDWVSPLNIYSDYRTDRPWLKYSNTI